MCTVLDRLPREFREDLVSVARSREPGQTIKQIGVDFGIADSCLPNWLKAADVEDGTRPGTTAAENVELRPARRRIRSLEQELTAPVTDWTAGHRANALVDAHRDDPEFGHRFLADEARDAGRAMAERTAWRICSANGW